MNRTTRKTRLSGIGWVPGIEAGQLIVGDRVMFNYGETSEVTGIEQVSRCFILVSLKSTETGAPQTPRRWKTTALIALAERKETQAEAPDPVAALAGVISASMELERDPNSERCRSALLIAMAFAETMARHPEFDRVAFEEACKPSWMTR